MNSLSKINNNDLESCLKNLVAKERKLLHLILEHIKEIEVRKIYLERAYSSMYEYLVKELGYSGSAAMRRLEAARLLRDVPIVSEKIREGSLNLSQIGELSKMVKEKERASGEKILCEKKKELVAMIAGKTTLETQKELSLALDVSVKHHEIQRAQKDDSIRLEITVSKEQYEKLLQCKDLAAHLIHLNKKDSSWASLIEMLAEQYLKTKIKIISKNAETKESTDVTDVTDVKNAAKPTKSIMKPQEPKELPSNSSTQTNSATSASEAQRINKTITSKIRREIFARDRCCQYKDQVTGKQCRSTYGLQVDHKKPRWHGGDNSFLNLATLCMQHNQLKYKKEVNIRSL